MKKDRSRLLIPCYRNMDPYELPEEFAHLQAQDMSKIGFINDIVRGIRKVIVKDAPQTSRTETAMLQQAAVSGTTAVAQIKRGNMALEDHEWDKADGFFEEALNLDPECAEAYLGKLMAKDKQSNWSAWLKMTERRYEKCSSERLEACLENTAHVEEMVKTYELDGYLYAGTIRELYTFDRNYDSELSFRRSQKERQKRELAEERLLSRAQQYAKGETAKQIEEGLEGIEAVLDQRIAKAQEEDKANIARVTAAYAVHLAQADKQAEEENHNAQNRREQRYQKCRSSMRAASSIPEYEEAKTSLMNMNGYKDTVKLAEECQEKINRLNEQKRLEEERQAAFQKMAAEEASRKRKKLAGILAVAAVLCAIAVLIVTKVIIPDYVNKKEIAIYKKEIKQLEQAEVGSTVQFGKYEQDNVMFNGKEPVEWVVLEKNKNALLVISKNALDCIPYNETKNEITWASSSLRAWLNNGFMHTSFSNAESRHIASTVVSADKNPKFDTDSGTDTQDQVFLLSVSEAEKYFKSSSERKCICTAYAKAEGDSTDRNGQCGWWLRSSGESSLDAACVFTDGSFNYSGNNVNRSYSCVRPALWINLNS